MKTQMILIFLASFLGANAQQLTPYVIASTGGFAEQVNAQISYTVGEEVIATADDGITVLTQGYQQPHFNITMIEETGSEIPKLIAYPNPTVDLINLSFQNIDDLTVSA